jgi:hypothetical protein
MAIDETRLNEFMGRAVGDIGAGLSAALVVIGDKLGLYKALAAAGPSSPSDLAKKTGTHERYVREWLCNQAAGGYVTYDPPTGKFALLEEQAMALAQEGSPAFLPGAFQIIAAAFDASDKIADRFRTGEGLSWGDHHACLFEGTERFFRPGYAVNLVSSWLPALEVHRARAKARQGRGARGSGLVRSGEGERLSRFELRSGRALRQLA